MKEEFKPKRGQECILYDRICTECGECMMCDLDPTKKCDNCGKCLEEMMPETNKKGFVEIPVEFEGEADNAEEDAEDGLSPELKELFAAYGMPVNEQKHQHTHNHKHDCHCHECDCDDDDDDCSDPNCDCHKH